VHSIGLTVEEADALAVRLFAGEVTSGDNRLVVDVASVQGVYGKLMAIQPTGGAFFPQERRLLAAYAGHAAAALERAAALESSRRRDRTARALLDLGRALADAQTPEETSERLATAIPAIVDCAAAAVFLWDEDTASMRLGAAAGLSPEDHALVGDLRIDRDQTLLLRHLLEERAPLWIRSDTPDAFVSMLLELTGTAAALVVPIMRGGAFLGVLGAAFDDATLAHPDVLVERLAGTASQAAIALDNARLLAQVRHQALHDPVTGLANIRLFNERAKDVLRGASRAGHRSGLLFVDLDRFKAVNDAHGHASGDELLREIGRRLGASVRETDTVARIGGDEFAVVLGRLDAAEDAGVVAGKLERALDEPFELGTENLHITASIGVAIYPDDGLDLETLLRRADSAMYTAKAGGRHTSRRWRATSPR
jgi:diguanylate cyclase (GGDEF)-like protein